jgi:hypothetical protein
MQQGYFLHERQPQASAFALSIGAGEGIEAFEYARQSVVRDASGLIAYDESVFPGLGFQR